MKLKSQALADLARLEQLVADSPFDAVVAVSPENVRYAADVEIATQKTIRDRLALVVWPKGAAPTLIICQVEEGYVRQETWIGDIRSYKEFVTRPVDLLAEVLRERGLASGRIGIELEYFAGKYLRQLTEALPQLTVESSDNLFRRARMFKSDAEKALLRHGFRGTEKAMQAVYATVTVGESEWSLSRRLADAILLSGSELVAFNHINAGPNTGFPHAGPSDYRVQAGDIVKADSGGFYKGYYSNVGRTAKVGKPTAEELDTWKRLREIHHSVIDMLRPGTTGRQIFEAAGVLHEKHKLPFPFAHNGHSIGLEVHEHPFIGPFEETVYEEGMVSTVETRVRWVGEKGLHMEDLIEITANGPRLMSDAFDNEDIFVI